jgi:ABC-type transport system involved in multi-copper enzyme maturation permease subunit
MWRLALSRYVTFRRVATLAGLVAVLVLIAETNLSSISRGSVTTTHREVRIGAVHVQANSDSRSLSPTERYVGWIGTFYIGFLLPVLALITAGAALREDLKPGTADYVFTRPIPRPAYLAFKYVTHMASAQADFLVALGFLLLAGVIGGIPGLLSAVPLLLLGQAAAVAAYSAAGFLFGVLTFRYVIAGLAYIAIVEWGIGNIPTQINRIAISRQVKTILAPLMPPAKGSVASGPSALAAALILAVACVLVVALSAGVFNRQEIAGGQGQDE